ncbi:MAG TPA: 16S rRNA (cytosine(967)-C(5))-methyltransferase RsmB, partial [Clostridiales bacterium]|nr:16S rRNA (cytosine(967)-C(5))-methyltransferase RsmB [Clostridiales bacterium]
WLVEKWIHQLGEEFTAELLQANNERPPLTIRTNTLKIDKQKLIQILGKEGAKVSNGLHVEDALYVKDIGNIAELESFQNGYFQVQDESSMLAVRILDPKPGEFVLDLCAAPGGKSTYIAQLMKNEGTVLARDIYDHKIKLIQDHAARLGIHIIQTEIFDAAQFDPSLTEKADKVLLDAPCSGLGIIRRKPEIKYSRHPEDLKAIADLQWMILKHAGRYVKKGGILVYSTCTINREENQDLIQKFMNQNTEFEISDVSAFLPATIKSDKNKMIQLFPNIHGTDGFFICRLKKK